MGQAIRHPDGNVSFSKWDTTTTLPDGCVSVDANSLEHGLQQLGRDLAFEKTSAMQLADDMMRKALTAGHEFEGRRYSLSIAAQANATYIRTKPDAELDADLPANGFPIATMDNSEIVLMKRGKLRDFVRNLEITMQTILAQCRMRKAAVLACSTVNDVDAVTASWT